MSDRNNMPDDKPDYEVGYGKPPKRGQFKKGQSGNPKGRPRGSKNFTTIIDQELNELVDVKISGKTERITKREVIAKAVTANAMKGDIRSAAKILEWDGASLTADDETNQMPIADSDAAILQGFVNRQAEAVETKNKDEDDDAYLQ